MSQVEQIKEKNEKYPVMIYAKSWCPYCGQVTIYELSFAVIAVDLERIMSFSFYAKLADKAVDKFSNTASDIALCKGWLGLRRRLCR